LSFGGGENKKFGNKKKKGTYIKHFKKKKLEISDSKSADVKHSYKAGEL
jgi:hypothetical protein